MNVSWHHSSVLLKRVNTQFSSRYFLYRLCFFLAPLLFASHHIPSPIHIHTHTHTHTRTPMHTHMRYVYRVEETFTNSHRGTGTQILASWLPGALNHYMSLPLAAPPSSSCPKMTGWQIRVSRGAAGYGKWKKSISWKHGILPGPAPCTQPSNLSLSLFLWKISDNGIFSDCLTPENYIWYFRKKSH